MLTQNKLNWALKDGHYSPGKIQEKYKGKIQLYGAFCFKQMIGHNEKNEVTLIEKKKLNET